MGGKGSRVWTLPAGYPPPGGTQTLEKGLGASKGGEGVRGSRVQSQGGGRATPPHKDGGQGPPLYSSALLLRSTGPYTWGGRGLQHCPGLGVREVHLLRILRVAFQQRERFLPLQHLSDSSMMGRMVCCDGRGISERERERKHIQPRSLLDRDRNARPSGGPQM